uniref:Uncharacterized protein n=1 Tax=Romanomermis culicivorax TaxID=13658 RepID=A0A915KDN1_ROMCU
MTKHLTFRTLPAEYLPQFCSKLHPKNTEVWRFAIHFLRLNRYKMETNFWRKNQALCNVYDKTFSFILCEQAADPRIDRCESKKSLISGLKLLRIDMFTKAQCRTRNFNSIEIAIRCSPTPADIGLQKYISSFRLSADTTPADA